jgi:hypothetical protein
LTHPAHSSANRALIASAALTISLAVLAVPYLFAAMFSVMMFDAPGSTANPWIWLAFAAVWIYPVLLVVAVISVWVLLARGRHASAFKVAVTGLIAAVLPAALFLLAIAFD